MRTRISSFITGYRKEAFLAPLFKLLEAVFELLVPIAVASLIDTGIARNDGGYVIRMVLLMLLLGLVGMCSAVTAQYFSAKAAAGFAEKMKSAAFAHIQELSESDRDEIGTATLITRLTSDASLVQNGINMFLRLAMRSPFIVFGAAIMAYTVDRTLTSVFFITIPLLALIIALIMCITVPMYRNIQRSLDRVAARTRDSLSGVRVLRAFSRTESEEEGFGSDLMSLNDLQMRSGRISALLNPLTYAVINIAVAALIWFGRARYEMDLLEIGALVALVNYMNQILVELVKLANLIVTISRAAASGKRIQALFDKEPSMKDGEESGLADADTAVSFSGASLTYRDGAPSLYPVSIEIKAGEKIGIIGGTGSGKTSLVNLVPRFYDVTEGSVSVFGRDVRRWSLRQLRALMGIVPQKAVLFRGSVRDNIAAGREATDDEIYEALKAAEAYDFIASKQGLATMIEEKGKNLSGGQRQRLTIARALLRKPRILILDDSTSALDFKTESLIRRSIWAMEGITVFSVSQRISSVMDMDRIIVLDKGRAVGIGTHQELLESCMVYREIWMSQTKEEA